MSPPHTPQGDPLKRLSEGADALERRTARSTAVTSEQASGQAYKIIAELFGGVIVGLGLGFGVDRLTGHPPAGLIGGVLLGFAVSIWMAKRTADRLTAAAMAATTPTAPPGPAALYDDEDEA